MTNIFSDRIADVPRSFIREILKDALVPGTISFAGGLPNRDLFPLEEIKAASQKVFDLYGSDVLQYSNSEGFTLLRQFISERYQAKGLTVPIDNILITNGSQQGLDLIGKVLLNDGDGLLIEEPGYLGAIQAFSLYRPKFLPVTLTERGLDTARLRQLIQSEKPKLLYTVPNFQNPTGITYPEDNRREIAEIINGSKTLLIEDNPYGELRFNGNDEISFKKLIPDNTILLGSFSKTVVPGFRIGWIAAPDAVIQKLIIAKQAADLHTNQFTQSVVYHYMHDNDINEHIQKICQAYGAQKNIMLECIDHYFPEEIKHTNPDGGMFVWTELPEKISALDLFAQAVKDRVVFVPGDPFYINRKGVNTFRLNYTCADSSMIEKGIERLAHAIKKLLTNT